ncbi:HugZ family protein [Brucella pituitosa]|uniref:HugZ family pyridoxamine 5'-phosphate oxidase n=1 Tax=Brucella pituitosa TaxID=571256 RepID=UPI0009A141BB|nr:pyridoxamine 5'-phosphate oxidase family protein [Brucella pituitosa]
MPEEKSPIRPTTPEAIQLAKALLRTSRYGAIAVLDPKTGRPLASRVAVATDIDGTPIILISALAAHTPGLIANPACSLLLGEAGKGDPLAHPRITLHCNANKIERISSEYPRVRRRYLNHNPKGALYVDLGDFAFFRLTIESASLNGGFGKAFNLTNNDLTNPPESVGAIAVSEQDTIDDLNNKYGNEINLHAARHKDVAKNWKITSFDPDGFNMSSGDHIIRSDFSAQADSGENAMKMLQDLFKAER